MFSCLLGALLAASSLQAAAEPAQGPAASPAAAQTAQQNSAAQLARGKALFTGRKYDEAKKVFEEIAINTGDPKSKILHAARLWLAKTLFMQDKAEEAVSQLEILLKNPVGDGLEPAAIYEAHFDLASCRFVGGNTMQAARDYLGVGLSAAPAGMEKVRDAALSNARLLACAMLDADQTAELERMAKTPDLQAFFLNERMQKYLRARNTDAFRKTLPRAAELLGSPSLSPLYRVLLGSLKAQEKAAMAGKMTEQRIGLLLPLEFPVYLRQAQPAGNRVFYGLYSRVLKQQAAKPDMLLNIATASTAGDRKNSASGAAEKLASLHKPSVMIGPLFSSEAVEASRAAKQAKVVMLTPTATDRRITDDNPWSFQLNPTHEERGRIAARELLKTSKPAAVAAVAEKKPLLEEMAKGFIDEMKQAGVKTVVYSSFGGSTADSAATAQAIGKLSGKPFDALYLPMDNPVLIDKTLSMLQSSGVSCKQLLGSGIWDEREVFNRFRSRLPRKMLFFSDYYPDTGAGRSDELTRNQSLLWNSTLSPFFWYGYDTLDYLANLLALRPLNDGKSIARALRDAPVFKAHYISFGFEGNNVNRHMNVLRYENSAIVKVR